MSEEIANYFRRCLNPAFAFSALVAFVTRALWSSFLRAWPNGRRLFQPDFIRQVPRALLDHDALLDHEDTAVPIHDSPPRRSLMLAAGSLEIDADAGWAREFADREITVSLHRWNWLLRGLTDDRPRMTREEGLALMRSWMRYGCERFYCERDAYSTGERIVNGSLFLLLTGTGAIPSDVAAALRRMGRTVVRNVEYHPAGQTGNHAFNNARALLFAGLAAELPAAVELALAISAERLAKLVTADGFMREGSSHYHFLFTRWVLEMLWLARRREHRGFIQLLTPYARRLVQRCWFFLVHRNGTGEWEIPLIGDVSPDCPPEWLLSLPWSSLACTVHRPDRMPEPPRRAGWSDLFGPIEGAGSFACEEVPSFAQSGWLRIDHGPWTLFVRAESDDGWLRASHSHRDLGSFVLFCDGAQILCDSGQLDYTGSPVSLYGRSASAHNSLLIDGLEATCAGPSWLFERYRAVRVELKVLRQARSTSVRIRHDGFARLARNPVCHQRSLRIGRGGLRIEDRLEGRGVHRVQARFHFAPGIELRPQVCRGFRVEHYGMRFLPAPPCRGVIQSGSASPPFGGLFFSAYGRQQVSSTLDLSSTAQLPATFTHTLVRER